MFGTRNENFDKLLAADLGLEDTNNKIKKTEENINKLEKKGKFLQKTCTASFIGSFVLGIASLLAVVGLYTLPLVASIPMLIVQFLTLGSGVATGSLVNKTQKQIQSLETKLINLEEDRIRYYQQKLEYGKKFDADTEKEINYNKVVNNFSNVVDQEENVDENIQLSK